MKKLLSLFLSWAIVANGADIDVYQTTGAKQKVTPSGGVSISTAGAFTISSITPAANFTLNQNSVAAITSVESGAIVNTLYLKAGNIGIGAGTNPLARLQIGNTTPPSIGQTWDAYIYNPSSFGRVGIDSAGNNSGLEFLESNVRKWKFGSTTGTFDIYDIGGGFGAVLTATPGTGVVSVLATAAAGTNTTQVATTAFVTAQNNNSSYRYILQSEGSMTAGVVAGTYGLPNGEAVVVSGTGSAYPLGVIQIATADFPTIDGKATKLRVRAQIYTNDVAPTGNYTFGLYPITRPATSGGAGVAIYTLGTVVSGSNGASFTAPAADLLGSAVGSDFAIPPDGPYVIGVVTTATVAASAHIHFNAQLQMRNP